MGYDLSFFRKLLKNNNSSKKPYADSDAIFRLSSAYITLETKLALKSTGRCGICVKKVSGTQFDELKQYIKNILDGSKTDFELSYDIHLDNYGYLWIIIDTKRIEDTVACIITVGEMIEEKGFSEQLLSAVFEFSNDGSQNQPNYLIYNYKLDKFYPFVPITTIQKRRNNQAEMKIMAAVADDDLPIEKDTSHWSAMWGLPF